MMVMSILKDSERTSYSHRHPAQLIESLELIYVQAEESEEGVCRDVRRIHVTLDAFTVAVTHIKVPHQESP